MQKHLSLVLFFALSSLWMQILFWKWIGAVFSSCGEGIQPPKAIPAVDQNSRIHCSYRSASWIIWLCCCTGQEREACRVLQASGYYKAGCHNNVVMLTMSDSAWIQRCELLFSMLFVSSTGLGLLNNGKRAYNWERAIMCMFFSLKQCLCYSFSCRDKNSIIEMYLKLPPNNKNKPNFYIN